MGEEGMEESAPAADDPNDPEIGNAMLGIGNAALGDRFLYRPRRDSEEAPLDPKSNGIAEILKIVSWDPWPFYRERSENRTLDVPKPWDAALIDSLKVDRFYYRLHQERAVSETGFAPEWTIYKFLRRHLASQGSRNLLAPQMGWSLTERYREPPCTLDTWELRSDFPGQINQKYPDLLRQHANIYLGRTSLSGIFSDYTRAGQTNLEYREMLRQNANVFLPLTSLNGLFLDYKLGAARISCHGLFHDYLVFSCELPFEFASAPETQHVLMKNLPDIDTGLISLLSTGSLVVEVLLQQLQFFGVLPGDNTSFVSDHTAPCALCLAPKSLHILQGKTIVVLTAENSPRVVTKLLLPLPDRVNRMLISLSHEEMPERMLIETWKQQQWSTMSQLESTYLPYRPGSLVKPLDLLHLMCAHMTRPRVLTLSTQAVTNFIRLYTQANRFAVRKEYLTRRKEIMFSGWGDVPNILIVATFEPACALINRAIRHISDAYGRKVETLMLAEAPTESIPKLFCNNFSRIIEQAELVLSAFRALEQQHTAPLEPAEQRDNALQMYCCMCNKFGAPGELVTVLPCNHHGHTSCFMSWMRQESMHALDADFNGESPPQWPKLSCPLCRYPVQHQVRGT